MIDPLAAAFASVPDLLPVSDGAHEIRTAAIQGAQAGQRVPPVEDALVGRLHLMNLTWLAVHQVLYGGDGPVPIKRQGELPEAGTTR